MKTGTISEARITRIMQRYVGTVTIGTTHNGSIVLSARGTNGITLKYGNAQRTFLVADRNDCNDWLRYIKSV